ncbi:MAG: hypothetical protein IJI57_11275 [Flexilinea sp.]|nr:hypothetical protein [Flexilinea sp.]
METLIQTGTDGKILSPDILKIRWRNETITLNNGETRSMDHEERIVRNRMILDKSAEELGPAFESVGIRDEDDVMTLIHEIRHSGK